MPISSIVYGSYTGYASPCTLLSHEDISRFSSSRLLAWWTNVLSGVPVAVCHIRVEV